jgi:nucleoside-diphosphate-sugar epimerase
MRYFVTGATGFVGGRVVRLLRARGHDVVALVRSPSAAGALALHSLGVRLCTGDVTDKASMREGMAGADAVFHIAGWYKVGEQDRSGAVPTNIDGTRHVMELMRELGTPRGVYTSTLAVNSDTHGALVDETYRFDGVHLSEYDRTKAVAHDIAVDFARAGVPLVIVQPGLIYGPGDSGPSHDVLVQYLTRRLPAVPRRTAFCWAHVDDVAEGHWLAMERGTAGENYFLAGPPHTLVEALAVAERLCGIPAPRRTVPPVLLKAMSTVMKPIEQRWPVPRSYRSEYLRVSAGVTYLGTNAKARAVLGWTPRDLAAGLGETLEDELTRLRTPTAAA